MKRIFPGITAGFNAGFKAPLQAAMLILKTPALMTLVLIPLAINVGLYVLFFKYGSDFLEGLIQSWTAQWSSNLPSWAAWVAPLGRVGLKFLAWLLLILVSALSFTLVSGIIAAPFNDYLSAMTERVCRRGRAGSREPDGQRGALGETAAPPPSIAFTAAIRLEARRTLVLLFGGAIAFFVGFLPLMQIPALAMGAMLMAFEYFGIPMSRRSAKLGPVWWFTLKHWPESLGLGTFLLLLMALPFTSIVYIPLAVVAGTMIYARGNRLESR